MTACPHCGASLEIVGARAAQAPDAPPAAPVRTFSVKRVPMMTCHDRMGEGSRAWNGDLVDACAEPLPTGNYELRYRHNHRFASPSGDTHIGHALSARAEGSDWGPPIELKHDGWYDLPGPDGQTLLRLLLDVSDADEDGEILIRFHGSPEPQPAAS